MKYLKLAAPPHRVNWLTSPLLLLHGGAEGAGEGRGRNGRKRRRRRCVSGRKCMRGNESEKNRDACSQEHRRAYWLRVLSNGGTTPKSHFTWLSFRCHVHVLVPLCWTCGTRSVSWCLTRNGRISWGKLHKKKRRKFIKIKSWSEIHWSKSCKRRLTGRGELDNPVAGHMLPLSWSVKKE